MRDCGGGGTQWPAACPSIPSWGRWGLRTHWEHWEGFSWSGIFCPSLLLPCVNWILYLSRVDSYVHPTLFTCICRTFEGIRHGYSDSHVSTLNFPMFCPYSSPDSIRPPGFWNPCLWNFLSINISPAFWNFQWILSHFSLSPLSLTHREAIIVVSLSLSWQ